MHLAPWPVCGVCDSGAAQSSASLSSLAPPPPPESVRVAQRKQPALSVCLSVWPTSQYSIVGQALCSLTPERGLGGGCLTNEKLLIRQVGLTVQGAPEQPRPAEARSVRVTLGVSV